MAIVCCGNSRSLGAVDMDELGFYYLDKHEAWLHSPTSSLIFMHELFVKDDDEIHELVFERCGENPSEWLISALKHPFEPPI